MTPALPEVEITSAMIEAGVSALLDNPRFFETEERIVELVFRAMVAKIPQFAKTHASDKR